MKNIFFHILKCLLDILVILFGVRLNVEVEKKVEKYILENYG